MADKAIETISEETMKRLLPPLLTALLLLAAGPVLAQSARADAPHPLPQREKVIIGMPGNLKQNATVLIAKAMGEFEKENLDVEYSIQRPTDSMVLLGTGRIDAVVSQASAAFFNGAASGIVMKQVAPIGFLGPKNGFWVSRAWLKDRPWNPALLKGQAVVSTGGNGTVALHALRMELEKAGLTVNDITWKQMSPGDMVVALENGGINVALLLDPAWLKVDQSKAVLAFPYPAEVTGGYFFGPNLLVKKRAVGEAFMRAMVRTQRTYLQGDYGKNPRVVAAMAKELQLTEDQVRASVNSIIFPPDLPMPKDFADMIQNTFLSVPGLLNYTKPLPDEQVMDRSFLRAAGAGGQ